MSDPCLSDLPGVPGVPLRQKSRGPVSRTSDETQEEEKGQGPRTRREVFTQSPTPSKEYSGITVGDHPPSPALPWVSSGYPLLLLPGLGWGLEGWPVSTVTASEPRGKRRT